MIRPIKVKEFMDNVESEDFEVVQKYETVDAMWGMSHVSISDNDIKILKEGKYLYYNDGEYAMIMSYAGNKEENYD